MASLASDLVLMGSRLHILDLQFVFQLWKIISGYIWIMLQRKKDANIQYALCLVQLCFYIFTFFPSFADLEINSANIPRLVYNQP